MVSAILMALVVASAPPVMTRDEIVERGRTGQGYSYWWGGGCWQADGGGNHGSCSGNCPNCTHSGTYGADCSGFVFKSWKINGDALSTCYHGPYTADAYRTSETWWTHVTRANAEPADILASSTHVVLLDHGDPWGTPTILEARGCSYGIQRNTRSLGSEYVASRRDNLGAPTPPAWRATYVDQSFPYASQPAIELLEGEDLDGFFDLRNDGAETWNDNTRLAPTPRDLASPLADDTWLSPTRIVSPGAVAPGAVGHFPVRIRANEPGEHLQTFGVVQEGVSWFSQSGGPPDTQLAILVRVAPRDHAGTLTDVGFPLDANGAVLVELGSVLQGFVEVRNDGHLAWGDGVRLAPTPRDQPSSLAAASWLSPTRVATPDEVTAEGEVARFTFEIAGAALGETTQSFALVHEGVVWFADAGFGPADDFLRLKVRVVEARVDENGDESDGDESDGDRDDQRGDAPPEEEPIRLRPGATTATCASAPASPLVALALLALVRRRARP
ncbi:MAG: hypothetical protein IT383_18520 [Deltaproteobacteria bacterium]|nr:hypothetical protein [Deltaproteobacteria bacterium]